MATTARRLLCRFRVGVSPLQVELGRRQPTDQDSRACLVCGHACEDEEHFLMACPLYDELRSQLLEAVLASLQQQPRVHQHALRLWQAGRLADRFDITMSLQGKDEIQALATYLERAWGLRTAYLASLAESGHDGHADPQQQGQGGGQAAQAQAMDEEEDILELEPGPPRH
jgi:hypothetical protein